MNSPHKPNLAARLLIVEDEDDVRELMCIHLKREGLEVLGVGDGEQALAAVEKESFSLAILDWMLPGISGLELCKRFHAKMPVLMVTARANSVDIIAGLEGGADDYVTKPFDLAVFLARVHSLLRRSTRFAQLNSNRLELGRMVLDIDSHKAFCGEEEISLTPSEFKLLAALIRNQGRVLTRSQLIELIQGKGIRVTERAIDILTFGLRKKLGLCAELVETVRGIGYRIKSE